MGISTRFGEAGACLTAGLSDNLAPCQTDPYPAVDNLIRRAQRAAAGRPDAARILAQTISMACPGGADPYAVLGVLIEGTVQTLVEHIPKCDALGFAAPEIGDLRYGPWHV